MADQFNPSGSYKYISNYPSVAYSHGDENRSVGGRGPLDVFLLNTGSLTISASDGTTDVELKTISGSVLFQTSSAPAFTGTAWYNVFPSTDIQLYTQLSITAINNHATFKLESGSIEFSPDNVNWETDWDTTTFAGLLPGSMRSMQIAGNSRKYLRIRAIPSGTVAAGFTGSVAIYVTTNNG